MGVNQVYIESDISGYTTGGDSSSGNSGSDSTDLNDGKWWPRDINGQDMIDFDSWNDWDKIGLFIPKTIIIYPKLQSDKADSDAIDYVINTKAKMSVYYSGRDIIDIKYEFSHQGVPTIALILSPVKISRIKNEKVREIIAAWGEKHGFKVLY